MDTIVRIHGVVNEYHTVLKTIKYLVNTQPGFYSIADIQVTINAQLETDPKEYFTRRMVRNAILRMVEKSHK